MELDKSFYRDDLLVVFKCLKTGRGCTNFMDIKHGEEYIMVGGGCYYNRKTKEQAEILLKRKRE